jgi:hypothetical protein
MDRAQPEARADRVTIYRRRRKSNGLLLARMSAVVVRREEAALAPTQTMRSWIKKCAGRDIDPIAHLVGIALLDQVAQTSAPIRLCE